jgi:hypothetical protein
VEGDAGWQAVNRMRRRMNKEGRCEPWRIMILFLGKREGKL